MHWIKYLSCIFLNSSNKFRDNITPIVNSLHLMNIYYLLYNYITIYYIYYITISLRVESILWSDGICILRPFRRRRPRIHRKTIALAIQRSR